MLWQIVQAKELEKFLIHGYPKGQLPVTFARYTGQESDQEKLEITANPPNILLTNDVMLELILTHPFEQKLINASQGLRYLVLDELHTYRGQQGTDVAMLVRRVQNRLSDNQLQYSINTKQIEAAINKGDLVGSRSCKVKDDSWC